MVAIAFATMVAVAALVVAPGVEKASANGSSSPVNLLAEPGVTIEWDDDFIGALDAEDPWPEMIYNYDEGYEFLPLGTLFLAEDINANIDDTNNCTDNWMWVQILCDPPSTDDSLHYVTKLDEDAGFTINSVFETEAYVVIDLGATRTFNTLRVFQMFSDGKVTQASLYTHSASGSTRPTFDDAGWQLAASSPVGAGLLTTLGADTVVACPTVIPLGTKTSRYVQLRFRNQGEFGDVEWIEVGGAKLFNETGSEPSTPESCPPEPPRNAVASAGNEAATVSWTPGTGARDGWVLEQSDDDGASWTTATTSPASVPSASTSTTVTGLTNGTQYVFRVQATSSIADSPFTPASNPVTPSDAPPAPDPVFPPSAPLSVRVTPGNASATVFWSPPASSGSFPVSLYQVAASTGSRGCLVSAPSLTCEVSGLTNGTSYTFTVRALNGAGWGPYSAPSAPVTPSVVTPGPDPEPIPGPLTPGESIFQVNGAPDPNIQVDPNTDDDGLVIEGDGWSMNLDGLGPDGRPLGLGPNGALRLQSERDVATEGSGFRPNSEVNLYVDPPVIVTGSSVAPSSVTTASSEGILVGTVRTDTRGSFQGTATLPKDIAPGEHVLQAVGFSPTGQARALSLGVIVEPTIVLNQGTRAADGRLDRIRTTGSTVGIDPGTRLTPWIRFAGQGQFTHGKATILVQADGTFRWTRQIRANRALTAYVSYLETESNRVVWAKVR